jgi:hypothetical protein
MAWQGNGMGAAWKRHAMRESALRQKKRKLAETQLIRLLKDAPLWGASPNPWTASPSKLKILESFETPGRAPSTRRRESCYSHVNIKFRKLRLKPEYSSLQTQTRGWRPLNKQRNEF